MTDPGSPIRGLPDLGRLPGAGDLFPTDPAGGPPTSKTPFGDIAAGVAAILGNAAPRDLVFDLDGEYAFLTDELPATIGEEALYVPTANFVVTEAVLTRAIAGASGSTTVDVTIGGTTIFLSPISVAASSGDDAVTRVTSFARGTYAAGLVVRAILTAAETPKDNPAGSDGPAGIRLRLRVVPVA